MMVREVMYVYLILLGAGNPTADFTMDYFFKKDGSKLRRSLEVRIR